MNPGNQPLNWTPQGGFATGAPAQQQGSGNWFTHLLPTLGSIGAGLLAPETGGLSLLAMPALSGLGSAVGKGVENVVEGQNPVNDVVGAAGEGALGGLLGGIGGKVVNKGLGMLGNAADKGVANAANASQAASDIAKQQSLRDAWGGVKPGIRAKLDLGGNSQTISDLGLDSTNPQHFVQTGNDAVNALGNVRDMALAGSGPVNMSNFNDLIDSSLSNPESANVLGAYKNARNGLTTNPSAKIYTALQNAGGGITGLAEADPNAVQGLVSRIQSMAADAKPTLNAQGVIDPTQKAIYNTYNNVANQLKDQLYKRPEVDKAFTEMAGNLRAEDVGGNQALADHLNETLNNAKTAQDVLTPMSQFINMRKLGDAGVTAGQDAASAAKVRQVKAANGISSSKIATDAPGMNSQGESGSPFGLSPGLAAILGIAGAPMTGGLSMVTAIPEAMKLAGKVPPEALQGVAGIGSKIAPLATSGAANLLTHGPDFTAPSQGVSSINPQGDSMQSSTPPGGLDPSVIPKLAQVAAMRAAMNGDIGSIGQLQQLMSPPGAAAAQNASTALQGLSSMFQQAGGGQGRIGGTLASLGGNITGGPAQAYSQTTDETASQIAQATGDNVADVKSHMPALTDTSDAAQSKFSYLSKLLQSRYKTATQSGYDASPMGGMPMGLSTLGV